MKKLLAPLALLFLVACQPSELDRCIEANKSKVDIDEVLINSKLEVVSNEKLKQQWIDDYESKISFEINGEGRNYIDDVESGFIGDFMINEDTGLLSSFETCEFINEKQVCTSTTTLGDLYKSVQFQFNYEDATFNRFNFQRHLDYNIKYYDLSAELIEKKQATSLCNAQGVY